MLLSISTNCLSPVLPIHVGCRGPGKAREWWIALGILNYKEILSLGHQSLKPLLSGPLWSEHNFLYAIKDQGPQLTRGFGITLVWLNQGSIHCRPEEIQKRLFLEKKVSSGTLKETMVSLCLFSIWFLKSAGRLKVTFFVLQKGHITVQWRAGTKRSMSLSTLKVKVVRLSVNLRK